jgi:hypothetical protein
MAISASVKQSGVGSIDNFVEFRRRMEALGLAHLDALPPMAYHDVTFMDWSLWSDDSMQELERKIHEALFPNVEFIWQDYCRANNLAETSTPAGRWRNCKCDVQVLGISCDPVRRTSITSTSANGSDDRSKRSRMDRRIVPAPAAACPPNS